MFCPTMIFYTSIVFTKMAELRPSLVFNFIQGKIKMSSNEDLPPGDSKNPQNWQETFKVCQHLMVVYRSNNGL